LPAGQHAACATMSLSPLQVCPYDCRHTLVTIAAAAVAGGTDMVHAALHGPHTVPQLDMVVYEEDAQLLARHMLVLYALLDGAMPPHERPALLLELHGNALLRRRTADWLGAGGGVGSGAAA
jgi:hypothetical protein